MDPPRVYNEALEHLRAGRIDPAMELFAELLRVFPDHPETLHLMAVAKHKNGDPVSAEPLLRRAVARKPREAMFWNNLGLILFDLCRYQDAVDCYRRAVELQGNYGRAYMNQGNALRQLYRLDEALACYDRALEISPGDPDAHLNRGNVLLDRRLPQDALTEFRTALALDPHNVNARNNLIFTLDFVSGIGFAESQAARKSWYEMHGKPFAASVSPHGNDRRPDRRLRLGYVSADFCKHSASDAFGVVLRHHDHSQFEVVCYSGTVIEDESTRGFKAVADRWFSTAGWSDAVMAEHIRDDRIDILIDLSGHSAGSRLPVFARKPAPIQVQGWGYGTGTGLPTMDYLFSDPVAIPAEMRPLFSETVIDLPCAMPYEMPVYAPAVSPLPASLGQPFTFGCLNRLSKVTDAVLAVWARVLHRLSRARLLLKDGRLDDPAVRASVLQTLARSGISNDRVVLLGRSSHADQLAAYAQIDIALDPFPQNGGITTYEALSMGVPVIALLGHSQAGRTAASILSIIGLGDWVAGTEDEYVALAVQKASDESALAHTRAELRRRLTASPAGDAAGYTRLAEAAYRKMWERWCADQAVEPRRDPSSG